MAITQAGTTLTFDPGTTNTGTVSSTITVPADAEIVVVGISGYSTTANYFSTGSMTFTKGGIDTTMVPVGGADSNTGAFMAAIFYLVLPDTGSNKTLKWDWVGAVGPDNNVKCAVTFWKGIDTSSPVRDTEGAQAGSLPYTTGTITAVTGDLIFAMVGCSNIGFDGTIDSWSNLTLLAQLLNNSTADGALATGSPTGNTTVAASTATSMSDGGIVAIALKPVSTLLYLRPDADSIDGGWTNELGGTALFSSIDETVASDTDYIQSSINPVADIAKISLSDPASGVGTPVILRYRYKMDGGPTATLGVRLLQGTTEIAAYTHSPLSGSFVTAEQTLTAPQLASISDFNDLYIEFTADT